MTRLFTLLLSIVFTTLAGIGIVVMLVLGRYDAISIIVGALVGGLVSLPVSWLIAKRLQEGI